MANIRMLVTGATGFVGRNLIQRLLQDEITVRAADAFIPPREQFDHVPRHE